MNFLHCGVSLKLRNVYKSVAPIYHCMYTAAPDIQVGTYPDLWQKGRYRVELTAQMPCDVEVVDAALQQLGYQVMDTDQWGRTYRHDQQPCRTAELDELEHAGEYVKLILRNADLDELDIGRVEDQLGSLYDRIHQMCQDRYENGYDAFYYSEGLEQSRYPVLQTEQYQIED